VPPSSASSVWSVPVKLTFAYALSEALGRPIARIPFGGLGSAKDLRGESRLHLEAEPGYIVRALCETGVKNPIILLDEIDRVTDEARADIMGVLVELLDPTQNNRFLDHFIDYPVDLSEVMFYCHRQQHRQPRHGRYGPS